MYIKDIYVFAEDRKECNSDVLAYTYQRLRYKSDI